VEARKKKHEDRKTREVNYADFSPKGSGEKKKQTTAQPPQKCGKKGTQEEKRGKKKG